MDGGHLRLDETERNQVRHTRVKSCHFARTRKSTQLSATVKNLLFHPSALSFPPASGLGVVAVMKLTAILLALVSSLALAQENPPPDRAQALRGSIATYAGVPRGKDRRVDVARLASELADLRVNTYSWLIHDRDTDWDDLKLFLPLAREQGIKVWLTLVPPSESPPKNKMFSEPFRLDYERWAIEIAKLSIAEPNLVAWSVDDFTHNVKFFTPEKLRGIVEGARALNPKLAFVPCCYLPVTMKTSLLNDYRGIFDGILFPYRSESTKIGLTDPGQVEAEVAKIRALAGEGVPVIVDVYASGHSTLGQCTPDYMRDVMNTARKCADGVMIYCHPNAAKQPEKHAIISELFHAWTKSNQTDATAASLQKVRESYQQLLALFPEDQQGFSKDADKNADGPELVTDHQPMTYGFVLSAEALHFRSDRNAESGDRVRKAARWLLDNRDLDGDGKPGWGLPQSWPAWGHAPNPHHQPYTITTAIALAGLLDALAIHDFWSVDERDEMLSLSVEVTMRWCKEMWSEGYGGGYFWYSPAKLDDIFGVNAPAMFLGSLARLLKEDGVRFSDADRQLAQQRCDALASAIVNTAQLHDGQPFWLYAPLPNKLNHERFEDVMHHVYTLWGIEGYRNMGGKVALPWSRAQALRSLDHFWKDGGVAENDQDRPDKKKPNPAPARLCGAGMLLLGYAAWGDAVHAQETLKWIDQQCGPWPQLRHSPTATADTVYLRDCAHVLFGLAQLAYRPN